MDSQPVTHASCPRTNSVRLLSLALCFSSAVAAYASEGQIGVVAVLPENEARRTEIEHTIALFLDSHRRLEVVTIHENVAKDHPECVRALASQFKPAFILGPIESETAIALSNALSLPDDPIIVSLAPIGPASKHSNFFQFGVDESRMRNRALALAKKSGNITRATIVAENDPLPQDSNWDLFAPQLPVDFVKASATTPLQLPKAGSKTALLVESSDRAFLVVPGTYGDQVRIAYGTMGPAAIPTDAGRFDLLAVPCAQTPQGVRFAASYLSRYGVQPHIGYAYQTFAALQIIDGTARAFASDRRESPALTQFIERSTFRTIVGEVTFNRGRGVWSSIALWHVDHGGYLPATECHESLILHAVK